MESIPVARDLANENNINEEITQYIVAYPQSPRFHFVLVILFFSMLGHLSTCIQMIEGPENGRQRRVQFQKREGHQFFIHMFTSRRGAPH